MIERLIATLFLSREVAHRAHLRVSGPGSYAAHMALGSFYDDIVDRADAIAEAYQGRHGLMKEIPILDSSPAADVADTLEKHLKLVEDMRYKAVDQKDTAIQNLIDEAVGTYLSVLYKLRNLE